jgi:trans-2,3-dihydro-3-hydroxyanthranilate isomerase
MFPAPLFTTTCGKAKNNMKNIAIHQVDAFTDQLFGGNPAGVVTNAEILLDTEMQQIAREMNLSETAFVLPPSAEQADVKLRYFTPAAEVHFCGHATVGALFQLAKLDMFGLGKLGKNEVLVETNIGTLPMMVTNEAKETKVSFTAPPVNMQPYQDQGGAFAERFGIAPELIAPEATILQDKQLNYVYIPVRSLKALGEQNFDFARIRENFGSEKTVIFCLFTNETVSEGADLHARGLAPNVGVDEDPFTGSMQAGLVHAAKQNDLIAADKTVIKTEQGHYIGRPGFANVHKDGDEIVVEASAVPVFSTEMELL